MHYILNINSRASKFQQYDVIDENINSRKFVLKRYSLLDPHGFTFRDLLDTGDLNKIEIFVMYGIHEVLNSFVLKNCNFVEYLVEDDEEELILKWESRLSL